MIGLPVFFRPKFSLRSAWYCNHQSYVRMAPAEFYNFLCCDCIKATGSSAEKHSVAVFVSLLHSRNDAPSDRRYIPDGNHPVSCKAGGCFPFRHFLFHIIHRISPSSERQGMLRSEPVQCQTAACVFCLPSVSPAVSFFA